MADILITGGGGYLGRHLVPLAGKQHNIKYTFLHNDPLNLPSGTRMDVRDHTAVTKLITTLKPQVIIHTVGSNRGDELRDVIVKGTGNIAEAADNINARLIHMSTDVVFNGKDGPYDESAPVTPMHAYGRAKADAEKIVSVTRDHVIIRTSLIYGLRHMDHGTAWMAQALEKGRTVTLFTNQSRNPIWVQTLCSALLELAWNNYKGILNVAGNQQLTRAAFGVRMLDWWQINPRETLYFAEGDSEQWPEDCTLDLSRAEHILQTSLLGVDEVLESQKSQFFKENNP